MKIIIEGSTEDRAIIVHRYLMPAFREMKRGAQFHFKVMTPNPSMTLTGPDPIHVIEKEKSDDQNSNEAGQGNAGHVQV
jgi:hypothetical protein